MRFVLRTNVVPHLEGEMWGARYKRAPFGYVWIVEHKPTSHY
jgi:hypothetical protein